MAIYSRTTQLTPPVGPDDHIQGPGEAPVTLVEYGDFECPYCGEAYQAVKQVQGRLGDQLRFVFRNFPLVQSHPYAEIAAEAVEAAGAQGKFWEMHDTLYEHQNALRPEDLLGYARELGLDLDRFRQDLETHRYHETIQGQLESGLESGVQGTPTFFINGEAYSGSWEPNELLAALESLVNST